MAKTFRKTIRINGVELKSPRYRRASDAERWYSSKLREKQHNKEGVTLPVDDDTTLRDYFSRLWLPKRKEKYPKPTWAADEQRFDKYVDSQIGGIKVARINQLQIRGVLKNVVELHKSSTKTRDRVRSLLSKLFNDAMNEDPPLRIDNPASNISFTEGRKGEKTPRHLGKAKDILKFIREAKKLSRTHYAYACIFLMAGVRKSEGIALRWNDFDPEEAELRIDEKFEQASMKIRDGTKSGSEQERIIPIPDNLVSVLKKHKEQSDYQGDEDFILCNEDGSCIAPRKLHTLHCEISGAAGVDVSPHGLRHSFGRQFAVNDGNLKVLQAIMGHSNSTTTDLYSKLAGKALKTHRNATNFGIGGDDEK